MLSKLLGNRHQGVDLLPDGDDNLYPMDKGTVKIAVMGNTSCGGQIDIDYGNGLVSRYCHLSDVKVTSGVKVTPETIVGLMGGTGASYPKGYKHLHWVVWRNGQIIDPLSLDYGTEKPLIEKVNALFRQVWDREPQPKESHYFQKRVTKDIKTEDKLVDVMKFWNRQSRFSFIVEMQRYGFF